MKVELCSRFGRAIHLARLCREQWIQVRLGWRLKCLHFRSWRDWKGEKLATTTINNCELNWLEVVQMFAVFRVSLKHEQRARSASCVCESLFSQTTQLGARRLKFITLSPTSAMMIIRMMLETTKRRKRKIYHLSYVSSSFATEQTQWAQGSTFDTWSWSSH